MVEHPRLFDAVWSQMPYSAVLVASAALWLLPPPALGGQGVRCERSRLLS